LTNEALLRDRFSNPINFTQSGAVGIEKGEILQLQDPRKVQKATGPNNRLAGIAAREALTTDTYVSVYHDGIFDCVCSGAVALGTLVGAGAANQVFQLTMVNCSGANVLGHALETGADAETIQIQIHPGIGGWAG
jgi:hypothetical protein